MQNRGTFYGLLKFQILFLVLDILDIFWDVWRVLALSLPMKKNETTPLGFIHVNIICCLQFY